MVRLISVIKMLLSAGMREMDFGVLERFKECGGVQALERLEKHPNEAVANKATLVLEQYCWG